MKQLLASFFLFLLAVSAPAATITFTPSATTVAPGGSITVDIYGSSVNEIAAYSLYLGSSNPATGITLFDLTLNTSLFYWDPFPPALPLSLTTTPNTDDLGAFANDSLAADTSYFLGTATLTFAPDLAPGEYQIGNTADTTFTDPTFTMSDFAPASNFSITVAPVPEPSSLVLLLVGASLLLRRRPPVLL